MRIVIGVGDLVQRTADGHTCQVLGGRAIERLGVAMCSLHRARGDKKRGFLGQNQGRQFVSGLASKPLRRFSPIWLKTGGDGFLRFGLKIGGSGFPVWSSKSTVTV
jgi:hypothetical protein